MRRIHVQAGTLDVICMQRIVQELKPFDGKQGLGQLELIVIDAS